jgi:signal transduction histidine kinase
LAQRDTEVVLERILEVARELTGARYAALGVLDERRHELARFITSGLDHEATLRAVGELPRGRGVLGVLIQDARPLRLADVGEHPQSYGFPPGHPPMRSFIGVPIVIGGQAWGNLYLTEKRDADQFTETDEEAVIVLAQYAATAIENARLYESSERRRVEAERALRSLEAARTITDAIAGSDDLDRVLELIVKRGRALVDARALVVMLRDGEELVVAAGAGAASSPRGRRVPISGSAAGRALEAGLPERIAAPAGRLQTAPVAPGFGDVRTMLLVPMLHRGNGLGVLAAFDRRAGSESFTSADEQLLCTFAAQAANAVAISQSVEAGRLRAAIQAADAERGRWARELHDQTLQALAGLRVLLASTRGRGDEAFRDAAIGQAIADIENEIANLRAIISDLRPSLLDDLGLRPALEALIDRHREAGLRIEAELDLPEAAHGRPVLSRELETTVYRLVQESLTNIVKHANARHTRVTVRQQDAELMLQVKDDGAGFDPGAATTGFGLVGMRERVYLAGGTLHVHSSTSGTLLSARLPLHARVRSAFSGAQKAAS